MSKKKQNPLTTSNIGTATFRDSESFVRWLDTSGKDWGYSSEVQNHLTRALNGLYDYPKAEMKEELTKGIYKNEHDPFSGWTDRIEDFKALIRYSEHHCYPFNLTFSNKVISVIHFENQKTDYLIPTSILSITFYENYETKSLLDLQALKLGSNVTTDSIKRSTESNELSVETLTKRDLIKLKEEQEKLVEKQKEAIEKIERYQTEELRKKNEEIELLQRQLLEEKHKLLAEANKKRFEMEALVEEMNTKIFYLETEIEAIQGYFGENIRFVQIRDGLEAELERPIVLYQKIRYLDEELGRYFSFRNFEGSESERAEFESILVHRDDLVELFAPSEKSISLIRISKSAVGYLNGTGPLSNILKTYDKYHGETLGILLRNGENLYLAWLDEEKIAFEEDMFYQSKNTEKPAAAPKERGDIDWVYTREIEKEFELEKLKKRKIRKEFSSRYILFSILQGLLDQKKLIAIPEQVNIVETIDRPNKYVVLSVADTWIEDNRFPNFSDMIDKYAFYGKSFETSVNESEYLKNKKALDKNTRPRHRKGDVLYVLQNLTGWSPNYTTYSYDNSDNRSNSINNRDLTSLVNIENGIYSLNLIRPCNDDGSFIKARHSTSCINPEAPIDEQIYEPLYIKYFSYFIIGRRTYNRSDIYGGKSKRLTANFRLEPKEFINLTFLNSVFIEYVIMSRKIGNHSKNYAHMVSMLNEIHSYLKKREEQELETIRKLLPSFELEDWQVKLSDWKLELDVHNFSEYQAKRFLKWLELT